MQRELKKRVSTLLEEGKIDRVLGWKRGELPYDRSPHVFRSEQELTQDFVLDRLCGANLSKLLIRESAKPGCIAVCLKPCDSYSLAQLGKEHRVKRENVYAIGVPCSGMVSAEAIRAQGIDGILSIAVEGETVTVETLYGTKTLPLDDALPERCLCCKSRRPIACDELLGETAEEATPDRFAGVAQLEAMTAEERFAFWQGELSRCIRCNACRNVCPACSCEQCVFDSPNSGVDSKASADPFEDQLYHIIRAYHVAGRCTDCGECSRVCPQHIPLHLLNRKLIADMNRLYGEYQAGEDPESRPPLLNFAKDDPEPSGGAAR